MDKRSIRKPVSECLAKTLVCPPYNVAFGAYLIDHKKDMEGELGLSIESLIQKCASDMKDFDFWRLGKFSEID